MALPTGNISLMNLDQVTDKPAQARSQLHEAVQKLNQVIESLNEGGSGGTAFIGEIKMLAYVPAVVPEGWLECDGVSISRSVYEALFLRIRTTYGSDDNQTFKVPDTSRRVVVGRGGGTSSVLANSIGSTGGSETVVLTTNEMPSHNHTVSVSSSGSTHTHSSGSLSTSSTGSHFHNLFADDGASKWQFPNRVQSLNAERRDRGSWSYYLSKTNNNATPNLGASSSTGSHSHSVSGRTGSSGGSHSHTGSAVATGGGQAHNNIQPSIVFYFMIYTGV